jgi:LemA protein
MGFLFFFLICVGTAYWVSWTKNSLVEMLKRADAATAEIATHASQRVELVPSLVETAKGYAEEEQATFEAAEAARAAVLAAKKPEDVAAAESQLAGAIGKLIALGDSYPELKDSGAFQEAVAALAEIDRKIADAKKAVNELIAEYNSELQRFPAMVLQNYGYTKRQKI